MTAVRALLGGYLALFGGPGDGSEESAFGGLFCIYFSTVFFMLAATRICGRLVEGVAWKTPWLALLLAGGSAALNGFFAARIGRTRESARFSEARTMAWQIRKAQERYLARNVRYAVGNEQLASLDLSFAAEPPSLGMTNFVLTAGALDGCEKGYRLLFTRCDGSTKMPGCSSRAARPMARYGAYSTVYDRCCDPRAAKTMIRSGGYRMTKEGCAEASSHGACTHSQIDLGY